MELIGKEEATKEMERFFFKRTRYELSVTQDEGKRTARIGEVHEKQTKEGGGVGGFEENVGGVWVTRHVQEILTCRNPGSFLRKRHPLYVLPLRLLLFSLGAEWAFPGGSKARADSLPRVPFCLCQNGGPTRTSITFPHQLPGSIL